MVSTFRALAGDKSGALPYDADLADQRARYGDGLLRRAPEQVSRQEAYESETHARVEEVRKLRAAEQERIRAAEVCPLDHLPTTFSLDQYKKGTMRRRVQRQN
jgi:RNA polymerase-associated protein CTR9